VPERVLVPVAPLAALQDCLRNRVVLEYPTFYVLADPPESLPAGFISEATYLEREGPHRRSTSLRPPEDLTGMAQASESNDVNDEEEEAEAEAEAEDDDANTAPFKSEIISAES
jgi:hypothetical protein